MLIPQFKPRNSCQSKVTFFSLVVILLPEPMGLRVCLVLNATGRHSDLPVRLGHSRADCLNGTHSKAAPHTQQFQIGTISALN